MKTWTLPCPVLSAVHPSPLTVHGWPGYTIPAAAARTGAPEQVEPIGSEAEHSQLAHQQGRPRVGIQ